jgi:hypothetical protein
MKKTPRITQMRSVKSSKVESRNAMLRQAIADDERNNNGRMFGRNTCGFFSESGAYPETWECVQVGRNTAYLRRIPSHPLQSTSYYRYDVSKEFGGRSDRPNFSWVDPSEVGKMTLEDCE